MSESVLIVTAMAPVPVDNGKRVFLSGLLAYFVDRLGEGAVHYALVGDPASTQPAFPGVHHHIPRPRIAAQLRCIARMATDRDYTAQEAMLGAASVRDRVHELVRELAPDIEVYDTVRLAQHAPAGTGARRRVLYLDDLFSLRYDRMLRLDPDELARIDPLGEFAENVPGPLRRAIRRPFIHRPVLRMERNRILRKEDRVVRDFDVSLLVNSREVRTLQTRSGCERVALINDLLPEPAAPAREPRAGTELVFLGRLNVPHNDDAICAFLREAMPVMRRDHPGIRLRIIGRGASDGLRSLAADLGDAVTVEGFVEDLDAVFAGATAAIAPMRMGTGIKIKLLDALGRGCPVITTSVGIDGIPAARDGSDGCVVEDDLASWPGLVAELVEPANARAMSRRAAAFYDRVYGWDVVTAQYDEIFEIPTPGVRQYAPDEGSGSDVR